MLMACFVNDINNTSKMVHTGCKVQLMTEEQDMILSYIKPRVYWIALISVVPKWKHGV